MPFPDVFGSDSGLEKSPETTRKEVYFFKLIDGKVKPMTGLENLLKYLSEPTKDNLLKELNFVAHSSTFEQRGGYNSRILHIVHHEGECLVKKVIGEKKGGFSNLEEALEIAKDIQIYEEKLIEIGLSVPPTQKRSIEQDIRKNSFYLAFITPWCGIDAERILTKLQPNLHEEIAEWLVKTICQTLMPLIKKRNHWALPLGLDSKCSNFTVDINRKMWFVDPFPPRYIKNGKPIVEWPEPKTELGEKLGYFKHFDVRGIILVLLAQLSRIKPKWKKFFEKVVFEELENEIPKEELEEFKNELEKSSWIRLRRALEENDHFGSQNIILSSLNQKIFGLDYNVYTLREIALELAAAGLMNDEELESFFKASHFEDELPQEKLEGLKDQLYDYLICRGRMQEKI